MTHRLARGLRAIVVVAFLAGVLAGDAGAATVLFRNSGHVAEPYQRWLQQSLLPTTDARIFLVYLEPACGVAECAHPTKHTIFMYNGFDRLTVYDFMHEVGHIVDYLRADNRERRAWARFVGQPHTGWWRGANPPGEQWAQSYALCSQLRQLPGHTPYPGYGWDPSPAKHRAACALQRRIIERRMVSGQAFKTSE